MKEVGPNRVHIAWVHFYEKFRIGKSIEIEHRLRLPAAAVRGAEVVMANGHGVYLFTYLFGEWNVLKFDGSDGFTVLSIYFKNPTEL